MAQTGLTKEILDEVSVLIDKGELEKAAKLLDGTPTAAAPGTAEKKLQARASMLKARLMALQDVPKAKEFCQKALSLASEVMDRPLEAETLCVMGNIQWKLSDFSKSQETLEKALTMAKALKDKRLEGLARLERATIMYYKGENGPAEREFRESILALEGAGDMPQVARAYNNFACVYNSQRLWEKSADLYGKSKKLAEKIGYRHMVAWGAYNVGDCYYELGRFDEAMAEFDIALPIFKAIKDPRGIIAVNQVLGLICSKKGEWAKAEEHFEIALRYTQKNKSPVDEGRTYYRMGLMYRMRGDKNKANHYLQKALVLLEKYGAEAASQQVKKELQEIGR